MATEHVTNVVQVGQQVPVYIDRPVDNMIHHYIPVHVETQKAIEVEVLRDVIVEKIVERQVPV